MSIILTDTPDRTVPTFLIKRSLKIELNLCLQFPPIFTFTCIKATTKH